MLKKRSFLLILLVTATICPFAKERLASEPFVSGDTFRKYSDHIIDIHNYTSFDPEAICKGDVVFVETDPHFVIEKFFADIHPKICCQYVLITHNGDKSMPGKYAKFLEDNKIYVWFSQNVMLKHRKLIPIPIGLENMHWNRDYPHKIREIFFSNNQKQSFFRKKTHLVYLNFSLHTNRVARTKPYNYFKTKKYVHKTEKKIDLLHYLQEVYDSSFVISPPGNGVDCHRTWEALYLGTIPVLLSTSLDPLFEELPVVIVKSWSQLNKKFLQKQLKVMANKKYNLQKLYFEYWINLINAYKRECYEHLQT